jgi:hypothetical protein
MNRKKTGVTLLVIGSLYAFIFGVFLTWSYLSTLRVLSSEEVQHTIWAAGGPLFILWSFGVPLGLVLGIIGAFVHAGVRTGYVVLTVVGFLGVVFMMTGVFTRIYSPPLFGIGGGIILILFPLVVWQWIKKYGTLEKLQKKAATFQLVGYLFFFAASWFLCGEFAPLRLKAFAERKPPSPIEIMVYLLLGWLFIFLSHYTSRKAVSET